MHMHLGLSATFSKDVCGNRWFTGCMSSLLVILYVLFAAAGGADAVTRGHHPPNVEADRHHKTQPTQTVRTGAQYVVAKDGSGTHTSVQEAINAVPANSPSEVVIVLKPGMYREKVHIPSSKPFITLRGSDAFTTTIVYSDWAGMPIASGKNDHRPAPPSDRTHQALAFRISGDMAAFYNCRFLGWQDTCSDHQGRHYFRYCYFAGSVDFIFGNGTSIYEECTLYARAQGAYTAQARSDLSQATGFVFLRCNVTGVSQASPRLSRDLYSLLLFDRRSLHVNKPASRQQQALLGRAWGAAARIIFAYSFLDDTITLGTWGTVGLRVKQAKSSTMIKHACWGPGAANVNNMIGKYHKPAELSNLISYAFIDASLWLTFDTSSGAKNAYPLPPSTKYTRPPASLRVPLAPRSMGI